MIWRTSLRTLAFSVSGSETYATKPVLDRSASHRSLWQVFELICFRVGDLHQLESPRGGDHRKLSSAECCGISRFNRPACMACFRVGQSRKQGMQDIHIRKQKVAGKSVPETTAWIRFWDEDVIHFTSISAIFKIVHQIKGRV